MKKILFVVSLIALAGLAWGQTWTVEGNENWEGEK
jgi:hypothetical protein